MSTNRPLHETRIKSLKFLHRGKVRDLYEIDADRMLIIQTDRLSAFDVILPDPIPGKGRVLTAMSNFWFRKLGHVIPNHLLDTVPESVVAAGEREQVEGRAFVVRKLKPLPIEAQQLPQPLFTPSTKAAIGAHDENISFAEMEKIIDPRLAAQVRDKTIQLYSEAAAYAATRGIIIADTKFEFGQDKSGKLYLIDEALTPDSSRFWPKEQYRVGRNPPSFDKQFVRDWLETQKWNKQPPAPALPADVLKKTAEKYEEALRLLTA